MNIPGNLKYSKSHEWVELLDDEQARIGLTDFAQSAMGDLVFVNLPEEGDDLSAGESFADVESVKAVSDVIAPMNGVVSAINEELLDEPEKINKDPYGAWLIEVARVSDVEELMDAEGYEKYCQEEA